MAARQRARRRGVSVSGGGDLRNIWDRPQKPANSAHGAGSEKGGEERKGEGEVEAEAEKYKEREREGERERERKREKERKKEREIVMHL